MNPSSFIFRFRFDLNLKDSHRRIFWVILMGLSKVVDFITVSVCFLQLACVEVKAQEVRACYMWEDFRSSLNRNKKAGKASPPGL